MASAFRLSASFLNSLRASFPATKASSAGFFGNPWYIAAAVAFSASNNPEAVPQVFKHALGELESLPAPGRLEAQQLLTRKIQEALFMSGLTSGYPKAINSLEALSENIPAGLSTEQKMLRDPNVSLTEYSRRGQALFDSLYGTTATPVNDLLTSVYPDMGWFAETIGYGLVYSNTSVLSGVEISYTLIASLIPGDTPRQIRWHLDNARRTGATLEEVRAIRHITVEVAKLSGLQWRHEVPEAQAI